ncbi:MAG: AmmeMemoRadiSam system protein B [bacterium]
MNTIRLLKWIILTLMVLVFLCSAQVDRKPAVAGQFYPGTADELTKTLKGLFSKAVPSKNLKNVVALIAPHAGYVYSGAVAAASYNQIEAGRTYDNIFIIGVSHHVGFEGASIFIRGNYETPLGIARVNKKLAEQLLKEHSVFTSRTDAHEQEHSVEVQIPFLQYRFGREVSIIPIVMGSSSPETCKKIAAALQPYLNLKNLFVISTDFSHFPPYADAMRLDKATAAAIASRSPVTLINTMTTNARQQIPNNETSCCGWPAVLTLLYMIENDTRFVVHQIDYKNSGDADPSLKDRVVGYHAMAVTMKENPQTGQFELTEKDKRDLLTVARTTIEQYTLDRTAPEIDASKFSGTIKKNFGTFVTLHKAGELRGCIGRFTAAEPVYKVIQQMAIASATEDPRFPSVSKQEVKELEIEISVLTPMKKITSIDEIKLGTHGIYIQKGMNSGTFLPQVALETGWTKEEFLGHCAQDKAGIGWDGWKDATIYTYEAKVFSEKELVKK